MKTSDPHRGRVKNHLALEVLSLSLPALQATQNVCHNKIQLSNICTYESVRFIHVLPLDVIMSLYNVKYKRKQFWLKYSSVFVVVFFLSGSQLRRQLQTWLVIWMVWLCSNCCVCVCIDTVSICRYVCNQPLTMLYNNSSNNNNVCLYAPIWI